MKKSTLLTALTAGMITVSTFTTYAIWDTVTAESADSTVTIRNPVTITATSHREITQNNADTLDPSQISVSGSVTFNVENKDSVAKTLTLAETITAGESLEESTDYTIAYTGTGVEGKIDSSVTNGTETYNYTITFTENGLTKLKSNVNQCTVKITATLN